MAAPMRLGNLTFSYAQSAYRTSQRREREEKNRQLQHNTLKSSANIFNTEKHVAKEDASNVYSTDQIQQSSSFSNANESREIANEVETSMSSDVYTADQIQLDVPRPVKRNSSFSKRQKEGKGKTSLKRNVSFADSVDAPPARIANVERSNSHRLINDNNNLQNLFEIAKSNESLNELGLDSDRTSPLRFQEEENQNHMNQRTRSLDNIITRDDYNSEEENHGTGNERSATSVNKHQNNETHQQNTSVSPIRRSVSSIENHSKYTTLNETERNDSKDKETFFFPHDLAPSKGDSTNISDEKGSFVFRARSDSFISFDANKTIDDVSLPSAKYDDVNKFSSPEISEKHLFPSYSSAKHYFDAMNQIHDNAKNQVNDNAQKDDNERALKLQSIAFKGIGGILLSSDNLAEMPHTEKPLLTEENSDAKYHQLDPPVSMRQVENLVSTVHEYEHLESRKQYSIGEYTSKFSSSIPMNYANNLEIEKSKKYPSIQTQLEVGNSENCHYKQNEKENISKSFSSLTLLEHQEHSTKTKSKLTSSCAATKTEREERITSKHREEVQTTRNNNNSYNHFQQSGVPGESGNSTSTHTIRVSNNNSYLDQSEEKPGVSININNNLDVQWYKNDSPSNVTNRNNKRRVSKKNKIVGKRAAMDYGEFEQAYMKDHVEFEHVFAKDNTSEGRASTDDGYETNTNGSELSSSMNSEISHKPSLSEISHKPSLNGLYLNGEHYSESRGSGSTNRKNRSLSNLHEILNLESEDERKKKDEGDKAVKLRMEAEVELEQGRKNIHSKLDNMLKARAKTLNPSARTFTKKELRHPDPLLVNEPPLIIDREPSLELQSSIERIANEPIYAQPIKVQRDQHFDVSAISPQPKRIDASFSKPIATNLSRSGSIGSTLNDGSASLFHLRDKEATELNKKESMLHELRNAMFKRSQPGSPVAADYPDTVDSGATMHINHQHSTAAEFNMGTPTQTRSQQQRASDVYNSFPLPFDSNSQSNYNNSQSNFNNNQSNYNSSNSDFNNSQSNFNNSNINFGNSSNNISRNSSFSLLENNNNEYSNNDSNISNSHNSNSNYHQINFNSNHNIEDPDYTEINDSNEEKLTDEKPINKNAIMAMLKAHIKDKTGFDSTTGSKETQPSYRPKIKSDTFSLNSRDVEHEMNLQSGNYQKEAAEPGFSNVEKETELWKIDVTNMKPTILISEYKSPEHKRYTETNISVPIASFQDDTRKTVRERAASFTTDESNINKQDSMKDVYSGEEMQLNNVDHRSTILNDITYNNNEHEIGRQEKNKRSSNVLDSTLHYQQTKKLTEDFDLSQVILLQSSSMAPTVRSDNEEEVESFSNVKRVHVPKHIPIIAPDSRGLNLDKTEYYNPEENDEKVIKPSEFKTRRYADKNKMLIEKAVRQPEQVEHAGIKIQQDFNSDSKLSLNDLKRARAQQRLANSRKLSSSEPLLDKMEKSSSHRAELPQSAMKTSSSHLQMHNIVRTAEPPLRQPKNVEKWSNEIYTHTNVGKINIPDSFQPKKNPGDMKDGEWSPHEDFISESEEKSDERFNERKHKREQNSNSSTPRASTPKKSRRRFSLSSLSGGSTPRSDVTESTTVPSSPGTARRPSSPSIGRRLKHMFSPKSRRKAKQAQDEAEDGAMDEDIMRRLNMNVHTNANNKNHNNAFNMNGNYTPITNGHASVRSESGNSVITDEDDDFGLDDNFLSTEEWLNSQQRQAMSNSRKPNIKASLVPVNSSRNKDQIHSWRVRKNVGKVTVPEVFSSSHKMSGTASTTKQRNNRSPVIAQSLKSYGDLTPANRSEGFRMNNNDVVFTSFDVNRK